MDAFGIVIRFALFLDLMAAFGLAMFGVISLRGTERVSALPLRPLIVGAAIVGVALSILGLWSLAASMAGVPIWAVDRATVSMLLAGTAIGKAWIVRVVALMVVALLSLVAWRKTNGMLVATSFAGGIALATLAWTGHGAMDEGPVGWLHLATDISHLLAAGIWAGALVGLLLLVIKPFVRTDAEHLTLTHRALDGFAMTGTSVVGVIFVTGAINSWLLVGPNGLRGLTTNLYGQLLVAKVVIFVAMIGLAAANRYRLVPLLKRALDEGDSRAAMSALRRSIALETVCAVAVLAIVAWLGTLEPIVSTV